MSRKRFVERILTEAEWRCGASPVYVAGRWAAKEAVSKAISARLLWHDVEIIAGELGRPFVRLVPTARADAPAVLQAGGLDASRIHISISHERGIAAAVAIWEEV